jgi:hypothetical protein
LAASVRVAAERRVQRPAAAVEAGESSAGMLRNLAVWQFSGLVQLSDLD